VKLGRVLDKYKVGKHFELTTTGTAVKYQILEFQVAAEAALDGIYVIRTGLPKKQMSAPDAVRSYKALTLVERAFRPLKAVDLKIRPIHHRLESRVRAHVFLCMLSYSHRTLTSPRIWKAEHVRFTAFPTGPLDLAAATDWWANLVGAPPQSLSMQQGALLQAAGPFGQGNLSLVCTTAGEARVDLLLGPISQTPVELPGVGEANQSIVLVQRVFEKWLDFGIAVKRVGVSGAILSNVSTKVEGYEALAGLLDAVEIDAKNSSDFAYQINRPRVSKTVGIPVNRISRWTVASLLPVTVSIGPGGFGFVPAAGAPTPSNFSLRIEYDVNTSPQISNSLAETGIKMLIAELVSFSQELWTRGDVP